MNKDNWVSTHQIVNGLGGEIEQDETFDSSVVEQYHINNELDNLVAEDEEEIPMMDQNHYIDMNLGYGDFRNDRALRIGNL